MINEIIEIVDRLDFVDGFSEYVSGLSFSDSYAGLLCGESNFVFSDSVENLLIALCDLITLRDNYNGLGISMSVFYDTLSDLVYRVNRFYKSNAYFGLSKHDMRWLGYVYRMETFKLLNLKFRRYHLTYAEIERSGYDYLELSSETKEIFYEGLPVIYVHIPTGGSLDDSLVEESFAYAESFFNSHFSVFYEYYVCRTWLLYPGLTDILSSSSNILKFAARFEIIGSHSDTSQSLERIYGTTDMAVIKSMDKTSSLMESAYKSLDSLGVSVGVIRREEN